MLMYNRSTGNWVAARGRGLKLPACLPDERHALPASQTPDSYAHASRLTAAGHSKLARRATVGGPGIQRVRYAFPGHHDTTLCLILCNFSCRGH